MHSINPFSDAYKPKSHDEFSQPTVRYSLTTTQIISRLAHRGSVERERVFRRL